jgi:hypothetical protein
MNDEVTRRRKHLEEQLQSINENFERDMRARGFDPAQAENSALPAALAKLYQERQLLLEELSDLNSTDSSPGESVED